jgi:hypothetical protein
LEAGKALGVRGFDDPQVGLAFVFVGAFAHQVGVAQYAVRGAFADGQIKGFDESARTETRGLFRAAMMSSSRAGLVATRGVQLPLFRT